MCGALELYGSSYDLPPVISGGNSMWTRGYGGSEPGTVIVVGMESIYLGQYFNECQAKGVVSNQYGVKNEESTWHNVIYVCRQARRAWAEMWPQMQWFQ